MQANEGPSNTVSASSEADETSMEHVCVYGTCAAHLTAPLEEGVAPDSAVALLHCVVQRTCDGQIYSPVVLSHRWN